MANYFVVKDLAPTHDPSWATATTPLRAAFFRAAMAIVLTEFDAQLAAGKDKDGSPLAPLRPSTIAHRRSAMGPADPNAPPLTPAHELSRTRQLVAAKVVRGDIQVYWKFDPVSGRRWGTILNYHRKGRGHLPVRDVFGLAPEGHARAKRTALLWWRGHVAGLPTVMPVRPRPRTAARIAAAEQPRYVPKAPPPPPSPAKGKTVSVGGHLYTLSNAAAKELLEAIESRTFTGFRSLEDLTPGGPAALDAARKGGKGGRGDYWALRDRPGPEAQRHIAEAARLIRAEVAGLPGVAVQPAGSAELIAHAGPRPGETIAAYQPETKTILINERCRFWGDPRKEMRKLFAEGRYASDRVDHIPLHEAGHAHFHAARPAEYLRLRRHGWADPEERLVALKLSLRAGDGPVEFVSEAYAMLKFGLIEDSGLRAEVLSLYNALGGPPWT